MLEQIELDKESVMYASLCEAFFLLYNDMMTKILITGVRGMVGLDLAKIAIANGHHVSGIISHRYDNREEFESIKLIQYDITNPINIDEQFDVVIHCAAYTDVSRAEIEKELCYKLNVEGTRNVRNLAMQSNAHFIYISTPFIFDGYRGDYREDDCPLPLNFYASTKLIGEEISKDYENSLIIRVSPIGMRTDGQLPNFVQWFMGQARDNGSFSLFTDVRLNLVHTETLAKLILQAIEKKELGILHLASRDIVNKAEIWDEIVKKSPNFSGNVQRISVDGTSAGMIAKRPKEMWLNVDKASGLGYDLPSWRDELFKMF